MIDSRPSRCRIGFPALACTGVAVILQGAVIAMASGQQARVVETLRIGTSGSLALDASGGKEETAQENLRRFIKTETGFENETLRQKSYQELAEKLAKGELHLGVFQGYELAWVTQKYPKLAALAIAVNGQPYRYAHVLVRQDSKTMDFAGLKGQSLALPRVGQGHLQLFVERHSQTHAKEPSAFFSKITTPENIEEALDDVVDGMVHAAVVDRIGLEAYKRRKPGRFGKLKEIMQSQAFPPPLVAYHDATLDQESLRRIREGLISASKKEEGQRLLNLYKLTGFEAVPKNFEQVLAETRKAYPPPLAINR